MNSDSLNMVSRLGEGHMPCNFFLSEPQLKTTVGSGHLGARDDQTIRISKCFDEMMLLRSLRPLRLLRSLRLQRL